MSETLDALRLPLWGSRLIEASAGTGKTWTIAALYLRLVLGHGDGDSGFGSPLRPAQILVLTFTRAATRELSERIRARLVDAARCFRGEQLPQPQDRLLQDLLAAYPAGAERAQAAWRLAGAAQAMDEAAVHTIDAWCQRMLREHAFDSGSLFDEELGADERSLLAEAARDAWRAQVYPLDDAALAAVLARWPGVDQLLADVRGLLPHLGPDLASAGATPAPLGQVWQQADAQHRQALQQAKQGWALRLPVLRAWLGAHLDKQDCPFNKSKLRGDYVASWFDALDVWASTPELALPALTPAGRQRLTPKGLDEARKSPGRLDIPADFEALDAVLGSLAQLPEPADALRLCMARDVARRIQALKARSGVYGFVDLVERLATALAGPNGARLRERIVQQYPVALIDEFQDTSPRQFGLFDSLYRTAANDRATALFLIGDPKQSIYAFRGADIRSYLAARAATAGRHYLLGTNHRSASALVQVVNGLFMQAELRDGPAAFRFRPAGGRQADNPLPFVPVAAQGRAERLVASAGALPVLTLCHDPALLANTASQRRLAQHCAEHIVTLLNDPRAGFDDPRHGFQRLRPADIAVLVRTGREAAAVRLALRQRRVASIYLSDQDSVLASPEAADLLRWLQAVANPLDSRLARAALATATLGLPLAELAQLGQDDAAFEQRIEQLRRLNRVWLRQGVLPMLRQTLHLLDLPARWLQQADGERRLTNVLHLAELLQAASSQLQGEQALIRWLAGQLATEASSADEQVLRLESDADLVKVVTVHKSKGLEYPLVYLPFAASFRGADIRSYLGARAATAGRHYLLGTNHRSASALVQLVNGLFMQAELRDGPGAFRFRPAGGTQADNPLPFVPVAAQGRAERLISRAGALPVLTFCHDPALLANSASQRRLAQHCAEHIVTLLNDRQAGFEHPQQGFQRLRPADIAVLVRTRREADAVRFALRQRRVASIYLSDQDSVLASTEAADLLRWLQAVANPLDSRRARAALATATIGLPLAELAQLGQDDAAFEQRIEQLRQLNRVWLRQGVLPMLRQTLHLLDLPARWLPQADGERRLTNVLHLAELLQAASSQLEGEQALIRWLAGQLAAESSSADEQVLRLESDADLVKVVTVHKSKGLEYPLVYLPFAASLRGAEQNRRQGFVALPGPDGQRVIDFRIGPAAKAAADEERLQEDLRLLYVALTRARHALWVGVAAIKVGPGKACLFHRSGFGRLLAGEVAVNEADIPGLLQDAFGGASEVSLQVVQQTPQRTALQDRQPAQPLLEAPPYRASFERNWGIGSFSALVRDLAAPPALAVGAGLGLGPARAEDLLIAPAEAVPGLLASAAQHRFPRGALAGNFLHDQLEWLAGEGFALAGDAALAQRLAQRCERQGWGHWAAGVVGWLGELLSTPLPPVGAALDGLQQVLPEMEFWFPSDQLPAAALDRLCRQHLLAGRPRPPLPERLMNGLLMGFADLVFEHEGRYWVLDYKSNALGDSDAHYHPAALEAAMAEHRYDVQAALYLLALHRLLRQRLGAGYRPAQHLGGAVYLFLRGMRGPAAGCYHLPAPLALLDALDQALGQPLGSL